MSPFIRQLTFFAPLQEEHANVGDVREKAEATRERLEAMKADLLQRKDVLRVLVAEKAVKLQAKKAQLQENNLQISLETMEQKLRQVGILASQFWSWALLFMVCSQKIGPKPCIFAEVGPE